MSGTHVVVGGGIAGLYAAHLLNKREPSCRVVVIEQAPKLGGLLRSFDYGENGVFDHGIHTFYETGIAEIDTFFLSVLPEGSWKFLTDYRRDLGGSSFEGHMQHDTPYPSLLHLPEARRAELIGDFFNALTPTPGPAPNDDAMGYACARFGPKLAETVIRPAIEARQGMKAEQVHWLALALQGMARIALLPQPAVEVLAEAPGFGARLAFPDQLAYPEKYLTGRRSYYPAKFGLGRFIAALEAQLADRGVEFVTSAQGTSLEIENGRCHRISVTQQDGTAHDIQPKELWWSVGMPPLAATLKLDMTRYPFDPPQQTVICNLLAEQTPNCGGVYYTYSHGHPRIHRVSYGYNYSEDVGDHGKYPISVELIYPRGEDLSDVAGQVEGWLREEGIIQDGNRIAFARVETPKGGFPSLSCKNIRSMRAMREDILKQDITNLTPIGILAKDNLFFQFDIIQHIHELIG